MKEYALRVYWMNGDAYSTVCTDGLDNGDSVTVEAETEDEAIEEILVELDYDFICSIETDPNFRIWRAVEVV